LQKLNSFVISGRAVTEEAGKQNPEESVVNAVIPTNGWRRHFSPRGSARFPVVLPTVIWHDSFLYGWSVIVVTGFFKFNHCLLALIHIWLVYSNFNLSLCIHSSIL
jgi:hypothetical protein